MGPAFRTWTAAIATAVAIAALVASPQHSAIAAANGPAAPSFDVLNYDLTANQDTPELCFQFNSALSRQVGTPLESFVATEPPTKLAAVPRNDKLCLTGFGFGATYNVTLKSGLPGIIGALAKEQKFSITVPNRPPAVAFASAGDLLQRIGQQGIPIRSVNTPKIEVELFHISDRDLQRFQIPSGLTLAEIKKFTPARGEHLAHTTVETSGEPNRDIVTAVPFTALGTLKAGLYVAVARPAGIDSDPATPLPTQCFTVSDLGLSLYRSNDSLLVAVRSLATAAAAAGVDLALVAENNRELARVRTDGSGLARFDPVLLKAVGGDRPKSIYAYGAAGEFSMLNIGASPLAIFEADPSAHPAPGQVTAMIYPDRGAYTPGETAQLTFLVRDSQGRGVDRQPLQVRIFRPDGVVFDTRVLSDQGQGGYSLPLHLPSNGPTGGWVIRAYSENANDTIGEITLSVADPVPARVAVQISIESAVLDPAQPSGVDVQGHYAFGGTAGGTPGTLSVAVATSPNPFPAFPGFSFGLIQEQPLPITQDPIRFVTDASGKALVPLKFANLPKSTRPLEARITATLFDIGGGRVERGLSVPLANQPFLFGVKAVGASPFTEGQPVRFQVIAVAPDGARQEKTGAGWEIVREDSVFRWSRQSALWNYRTDPRDTHVAGGMVNVSGGDPATIEANLPAGAYRIEVFDPNSETASSARFQVGFGQAATKDADVPDTLELTPSKPFYAPGDTAEIFVKPPYDAEVTLATVGRAIQNAFVQHVPATGANIRVDIPRDVDSGMRVLVTAVAPPGGTTPGLPRRAAASLWLPFDPAARRLDIKLNLPEKASPRQNLGIPVSIANSGTAAGEESVFLTVTAFDDDDAGAGTGKFDPSDFFYGKRSPAVSLSDLYGHVIDSSGAARRTGRIISDDGVKIASAAEPAPQFGAIVSMYSGIVTVDKSGKAVIPLTIPDFAGNLQVIAVAWSASRVGYAQATTAIRDPLATHIDLPKFLAPDDRATATLSIENVDGPRGEYHVTISTEGSVSLPAPAEITANLAEREQRAQTIELQAHGPGRGAIVIAVRGPGDVAFERRFDLNVRAGNPILVKRAYSTLGPGARLSVDPTLAGGLRSDSVVSSVAVSRAPQFDLRDLANELARENFGDAEQAASSVSIALFPPQLAKQADLFSDQQAKDAAIRDSLARLYGAQASNGRFGARALSGGDPWLTAYVLDILGQARARGILISDEVFQRGLPFLAANIEPRPDSTAPESVSQASLESAAYAIAVLAKNNRANIFGLHYFRDRFLAQIRNPLAVGWLATAYAGLGDRAEAGRLFSQAGAVPRFAGAGDPYASELRDQAALTALMAESGVVPPAALAAAMGKTVGMAASRRRFSPQEAAWITRASIALSDMQTTLKLSIDEGPVSLPGPIFRATESGGANQLPPIKNIGDTPLSVAVTATGAANAVDPKEGGGFEIQHWLFDRAGKPIDPMALRQGDLLIVVVTGRVTSPAAANPVIIDKLPAGWEMVAATVENPVAQLPWLKDLSGAYHVAIEEDRYIAMPNLTGDKREFKLAYVVRALTLGQYLMPGGFIEDIYHPDLFARGANGRTKITARP